MKRNFVPFALHRQTGTGIKPRTGDDEIENLRIYAKNMHTRRNQSEAALSYHFSAAMIPQACGRHFAALTSN
ncbi:hypothetical protein [Noviherbaspirillum galbum]|uniref:Uncharacterized protein n=1 Tax=Noviherbaspirillum galbum TaxID=2709383 RepID=A0A6B3SU44_9BURK|nr:hypothetical protein [Noviherbaspirillum galbum]NEX63988.1 hypothetical protein [Noviherbaspirillum galbum]